MEPESQEPAPAIRMLVICGIAAFSDAKEGVRRPPLTNGGVRHPLPQATTRGGQRPLDLRTLLFCLLVGWLVAWLLGCLVGYFVTFYVLLLD